MPPETCSSLSPQEQNALSPAQSTKVQFPPKKISSLHRDGLEEASLKAPSNFQTQAESDGERSEHRRELRLVSWDESESELLVALRAHMVSWPVVGGHFPLRKIRDLRRKFSMLQRESQWHGMFDSVKAMDFQKRLRVIRRAKSAVSRCHTLQGRSSHPVEWGRSTQERVLSDSGDESVEYRAGDDHISAGEANDDDVSGVEASTAVDHEEILEKNDSTQLLAESEQNMRAGEPPRVKFVRHFWDDKESELLVALRARKVTYQNIVNYAFTDWSIPGIRLKVVKLGKDERWQARFDAIQQMDETEQLATVVAAQAAAAHSRHQRIHAEKGSRNVPRVTMSPPAVADEAAAEVQVTMKRDDDESRGGSGTPGSGLDRAAMAATYDDMDLSLDSPKDESGKRRDLTSNEAYVPLTAREKRMMARHGCGDDASPRGHDGVMGVSLPQIPPAC